jgi:MFS family permease
VQKQYIVWFLSREIAPREELVMTTTSTPPGHVTPPPGAHPSTPEGDRILIRGPLRKLLVWLVPLNVGLYLIWGSVPQILLPIQIAGIDEENKVANLAVVTSIGALVAMFAQPIAGVISDRTRTRFGRRAPLMVAGALVGGLALMGMAAANGLVQLTIAWVSVQIAYQFLQGPLTAILPDRVPSGARGRFAAVAGLALMVGSIAGQGFGAAFAQNIGAGYVALGGIALVTTVLFLVFNPDTSSAGAEREPWRWTAFLRTFWVNPLKHPDFFWAFTGRLLLYLGYFVVFGYNLFLLEDYIGLGDGAPAFVPILGLVSLAGILVSTVIGGTLSDRLGRRRIFVLIASVLVALGMVAPLVSPTTTGMLVFGVIAGLGFGAFQAVDQALITEVLPDENARAKDLGVVNIAATLPQTLAPALGGAVVLSFGYVGLFPVAIVLAILGAFAVFFIKSVR